MKNVSSLRINGINKLHKPDNVYAYAWLSVLLVTVFTGTDLYCLKTIWNLVLEENPEVVWTLAIACAIGLDVPLAIAANQQRKYEQGLCTKRNRNLVVIFAVITFSVVFLFSLVFRVYTRELFFNLDANSEVTNMVAETISQSAVDDENGMPVLVASLFNGIIPLVTSLASFLVSYVGYDPLGIKLHRLETIRVRYQSNILDAKKALAEAEDSKTHCEGLIARENDIYQTFLEQLNAETHVMKQLVRLLMMEKLKTASNVTALTKSTADLLANYPNADDVNKEYAEYVMQHLTCTAENVEIASLNNTDISGVNIVDVA